MPPEVEFMANVEGERTWHRFVHWGDTSNGAQAFAGMHFNGHMSVNAIITVISLETYCGDRFSVQKNSISVTKVS